MARTTLVARRAAAPALPMPRELGDATTTPDIVTIPARTVLALEGTGAPESQVFQQSVAAIYGVAILKEAGLASRNAHSEVYLNDPRRTKPEKLKTVLLLEA